MYMPIYEQFEGRSLRKYYVVIFLFSDRFIDSLKN